MPTIHLTTFIEAPIERVFDLSRSIDLHKKSMSHTNEDAVAGTTSGLIALNEFVTWKAKHIGKVRVLKSRITDMKSPHSFTDEMVEGDFKQLKHEHHFKSANNGTFLIDLFTFEIPYGVFGVLFTNLYLKKYLKRLLEQRNAVIKEYAESNKWKTILQQ
jgi:ligand-binding SRPBCC domain-containing protein